MKRTIVLTLTLALAVVVLMTTSAVVAGFLKYTASVKLAKDHKKGEVVRCERWTQDVWDRKNISCEEDKWAK